MIDGILTPAFLQAAGRAGKKKENVILLTAGSSTNSIREITCSGAGKILYIENGENKQIDFVGDLGDTAILPDTGTIVEVVGNISAIKLANTGWTLVDTTNSALLTNLLSLTLVNTKILKIGASVSNLTKDSAPSRIEEVYYAANNSSVSATLADWITNSNFSNGVLHTDSDGAYYSTIADAATAKGWTIEQL